MSGVKRHTLLVMVAVLFSLGAAGTLTNVGEEDGPEGETEHCKVRKTEGDTCIPAYGPGCWALSGSRVQTPPNGRFDMRGNISTPRAGRCGPFIAGRATLDEEAKIPTGRRLGQKLNDDVHCVHGTLSLISLSLSPPLSPSLSLARCCFFSLTPALSRIFRMRLNITRRSRVPLGPTAVVEYARTLTAVCALLLLLLKERRDPFTLSPSCILSLY